jgi:hypothetical protein
MLSLRLCALLMQPFACFAGQGSHLWSTRMDGNDFDQANSVAFDQTGRMAVGGYYRSTQLLIYNSNGQVAAILPRNGSQAAFVSVYSSDGSHLWSTRIDGDNGDVAYSVSFDLSGRLAVAGGYQSTQLLIYHSNGQVAATLPGNGFSSAFVCVFASDGNHLWSTRMSGNNNDYALSIDFDGSSRLAVAGYYQSSLLLIYNSTGQAAAMLPRDLSQGAFVSVFDVYANVGNSTATPNTSISVSFSQQLTATSNRPPGADASNGSVSPAWVIMAAAGGGTFVLFAAISFFVLARRNRRAAKSSISMGRLITRSNFK